MARAYVALGSNLGDSRATLARAAAALGEVLRDLKASRLYESAPMYVEGQPRFLNAAVSGDTSLGPMGLLRKLKELERELGRKPGVPNGPRIIDLDLVAYGEMAYEFFVDGESRLRVPHPRAAERGFVVFPLEDLNPDLILPGSGRVGDLADELRRVPQDVYPIEAPLHG